MCQIIISVFSYHFFKTGVKFSIQIGKIQNSLFKQGHKRALPVTGVGY